MVWFFIPERVTGVVEFIRKEENAFDGFPRSVTGGVCLGLELLRFCDGFSVSKNDAVRESFVVQVNLSAWMVLHFLL